MHNNKQNGEGKSKNSAMAITLLISLRHLDPEISLDHFLMGI